MKLEVFGYIMLFITGTFIMINYYDVHIALLSYAVQEFDVWQVLFILFSIINLISILVLA